HIVKTTKRSQRLFCPLLANPLPSQNLQIEPKNPFQLQSPDSPNLYQPVIPQLTIPAPRQPTQNGGKGRAKAGFRRGQGRIKAGSNPDQNQIPFTSKTTR